MKAPKKDKNNKGTALTIRVPDALSALRLMLTDFMATTDGTAAFWDIKDARDYITKHAAGLKVKRTKDSKGVDLSYTAVIGKGENPDEVSARLAGYFNNLYVAYALHEMVGLGGLFAGGKGKGGTDMMRIGGHAVDNMLKKPRQRGGPSLWDELRESTKQKIKEQGITIDHVNLRGEGIKLTGPQNLLILCLLEMLHKKSANVTKPLEPGYYLGNAPAILNSFPHPDSPRTLELQAPGINVTPYELAKAYYRRDIGGEDVQAVLKMLAGLEYDANLWPIIRYTHTEIIDAKKGKAYRYKVEQRRPVVKTTGITRETLEGRVKVNEHTATIIHLNPVFIDQIATKYVEVPLSLVNRLLTGKEYSNVTILLIWELLQARSNRNRLKRDGEGNYIYECGLLKNSAGERGLYWLVGENYMRNREESKLKKHFAAAVAAAQKEGILVNFHERKGAAGGPVGVFILPENLPG